MIADLSRLFIAIYIRTKRLRVISLLTGYKFDLLSGAIDR